MTTTEIQLPKVAQTRISRLAHASGRSPAAMLRFVLRDGFVAEPRGVMQGFGFDSELAGLAGIVGGWVDVFSQGSIEVVKGKEGVHVAVQLPAIANSRRR